MHWVSSIREILIWRTTAVLDTALRRGSGRCARSGPAPTVMFPTRHFLRTYLELAANVTCKTCQSSQLSLDYILSVNYTATAQLHSEQRNRGCRPCGV
jgi:hypothetical protein